MFFYVIKIGISAVLITLISELAKRSSVLAALLASLPLVSLLAILWLHWEGEATTRIMQLSHDIFWLVLPSLVFFVTFPLCLRQKLNFYLALIISMALTAAAYLALMWLLTRLGKL